MPDATRDHESGWQDATYVPTDTDVRNEYATRMAPLWDTHRFGLFDRWLASHDAEVARAAGEKALEHVAEIIDAAAEVVNSSAWRGAYRNCAERIREYARADRLAATEEGQ